MRNNAFLITMFLVIVAMIVGTSTTFADPWSKEVVDLKSNVLKSYSRGIEVDAHGNTHIVYGHNNLSHAFFVRGKWKYEVVDASPGVGQYASLAMDKDGQMHISYYDAINKDLKYAKGNFGAWSVETVGSNGRDEGKYTSLTVDASGYVHISYVSYDAHGKGTLNYATNKSGAWVTEKVAENVDYETSIAVDAGGKAHISYCETIPHTVCSLIYTRKESNVWNGERLESGNGELLVGRNSSLVVDTTGKIHITYESSSLNQQGTTVSSVKYVSNTMGQWSPKVVFAGDNKGGISQYVYASLAVDKLGNAHIVSNETSSNALSSGTRYYTKVKYAKVDSEGIISEQTVDEMNSAQRASYGIPSLAIMKSGETYVSYVENNKLLLMKAPSTITVKSPNGGESWTAGDKQSITWTYTGNPGVDVGINLLKGGSFARTIISSTPLTSGLYDWKIPSNLTPGSGTSGYQVKVASTANSAINDKSDENFEIKAATGTITVKSPNGGESWTAGDKQVITWDYTGNPGAAVKINLLEGGVYKSTIISNTPTTDKAYSWKIPSNLTPGSGTAGYQVRVISTANNTIKDDSDENFEIKAPTGTITVKSPNGGESWTAGDIQAITWNYTKNPGAAVRINLLKGGVYKSTIISNTPIADKAYDWKIPSNLTPGSGTAGYQVKVISTANSTIKDDSDGNFEIKAPTGTITVKSPNGPTDIWTAGDTRDITWESTGNPGAAVKINLLKGDVYKSTITSNTPTADKEYSWKIPTNLTPGSGTAGYKVRVISAANSTIKDDSNANFEIRAATGTITVGSPNGGEQWEAGDEKTITWIYTGNPGSAVGINLLKGGNYKRTIVSGTPIVDGAYNWKIPVGTTPDTDYTVQVISTANSAIKDVSNANFEITPSTGSIGVVTPNGGQTWPAGSTQTINWNYTGNVGSAVKIELYKGVSYNSMISYSTSIGSSGSGSYNWTIPEGRTPDTDYKVKITSTTVTSKTDLSDANFTISALVGTITVSAPNGGETWPAGSTQTIKWNYTGNPGSTVSIMLYKAGSFYSDIVKVISTGTSGSGSYNWKIPVSLTSASDYRVVVASVLNPLITDQSNNFTVSPSGAILVVTPNGGETWQAGTMQTIQWSYTGNPGSTVDIKLYKGGVLDSTIVSSTSIGSAGSGSYNWTIPGSLTTASDYQVEVTSTFNSSITDKSNNFTIVGLPDAILVSAPDGGSPWQAGTTQMIQWSYTGNPGSTVSIKLYKAGVLNSTIVSSTSTGSGGIGSYSWAIPESLTPASDYKVEVASVLNPLITDQSNNFTISPLSGTILVVTPNGTEPWQVGTTQTIQWSYTENPGSMVSITLLKNGSFDSTIVSSTSTGTGTIGSYSWTIPAAQSKSKNYKVEVTSVLNPLITDQSNKFEIQ